MWNLPRPGTEPVSPALAGSYPLLPVLQPRISCLTCCYLRAFALAATLCLEHFLQSPTARSLPSVTLQRSLTRSSSPVYPPPAFLTPLPSLLCFSPVTSFFCLPLQNIHPMRGQELCFIRCCIPSAENGDWHEGSAGECLLTKGISLYLRPQVRGCVPEVSSS